MHGNMNVKYVMTLDSLLGLSYKSRVVADDYRTQAERQLPVKI